MNLLSTTLAKWDNWVLRADKSSEPSRKRGGCWLKFPVQTRWARIINQRERHCVTCVTSAASSSKWSNFVYSGNANQHRSVIVEFSSRLRHLLLLRVSCTVLATARVIETPLFWWIAYCPNKGTYNLCFVRVLQNERFLKSNTFLF